VDDNDIEEGDIIKINLDREWALGQFCHRLVLLIIVLTLERAEIAHYFYHWRFNLREQVKTALRHIKYASPEKKAYIENLPTDLQYKYNLPRISAND